MGLDGSTTSLMRAVRLEEYVRDEVSESVSRCQIGQESRRRVASLATSALAPCLQKKLFAQTLTKHDWYIVVPLRSQTTPRWTAGLQLLSLLVVRITASASGTRCGDPFGHQPR